MVAVSRDIAHIRDSTNVVMLRAHPGVVAFQDRAVTHVYTIHRAIVPMSLGTCRAGGIDAPPDFVFFYHVSAKGKV